LNNQVIDLNSTIEQLYKLKIINDNIFKGKENILFYIEKNKKIKSSDDKEFILKTYSNDLLRYHGPRSYIDFKEEEIFLITGSGYIMAGYLPNNEDTAFKLKIIGSNFKNNILKFSTKSQLFFNDYVRGIKIINNYIYISYINEIKKDCFSLNLARAKINKKNLEFEEILINNECVNNYTYNSGGSIAKINEDEIILTYGDFSQFEKAQNNSNYYGKILKINTINKQVILIAKGIRNSLGIDYDKETSKIIFTEMGPKGGDEVNLFTYNEDYKEILNFGWPISSYGEHYTFDDIEKYDKIAPLYKSHKNYKFEEPLIYFTPSIAPASVIILKSDTLSYRKNEILFSTLGYNPEIGSHHLYHLVLDTNEKKTILKKNKLYIDERIRDIKIHNNRIIMFLETSGSIAILDSEK
jgi:hypothetical protein